MLVVSFNLNSGLFAGCIYYIILITNLQPANASFYLRFFFLKLDLFDRAVLHTCYPAPLGKV